MAGHARTIGVLTPCCNDDDDEWGNEDGAKKRGVNKTGSKGVDNQISSLPSVNSFSEVKYFFTEVQSISTFLVVRKKRHQRH